jgi:acyl dehydratase
MQRYWEDVSCGDTVGPVDYPMSLYRFIVIAAGDRDFTPIHHNPHTARQHGAPDIFVNNTALFAMWERTIREYIGLGGVITQVRRFRMVTFNLVGETITVRGKVNKKWRESAAGDRGHVELSLQAEVSRGISVGPGSVVVTLPIRDGPADQQDASSGAATPTSTAAQQPSTGLSQKPRLGKAPKVTITSDMPQLAWVHSLLGKRFRCKPQVYRAQSLTLNSSIQYSLGIGDLNPLFLDPQYAESVRGEYVPSPTWLSKVIRPMAAVGSVYAGAASGLTGVEFDDFEPVTPPIGDDDSIDHLHALMGGVDWTFLRSPRLGETFEVTGRLTDVEVKQSRSYGTILIPYGELEYCNQDGIPLARVRGWATVHDQRNVSAERTRAVQEILPAPVDQVVPVEDTWALVQRQGAVPRYWEDVMVGEALPPLPKGTLRSEEIAAFTAAFGYYLPWRSFEPREEDELDPEIAEMLASGDREGAARGFREPRASSANRSSRLHTEGASAYGVPAAFDLGEQRVAWGAQYVTDWIGDHGDVKAFGMDIRRFLTVGDTATFNGTVTGKRNRFGEHLVDLAFWLENHRGRRISTGTATVALPVR